MKLLRMTLPAGEGVRSSESAIPAGVGDGESPHCAAALSTAQPFAVLDLPREDSRWCADCGGPQTFRVVAFCEAGRIGFCAGCEAKKLIPFLPEEQLLWPWERTNSEVA